MCKDKDSFLYKNVLFYKSFGILRVEVMSERAGWVDTLPLSDQRIFPVGVEDVKSIVLPA